LTYDGSPLFDRLSAGGVLRPPDAAEFCGLSIQTMSKLRLAGQGPRYIKLTKRKVGYRLVDLATWLKQRQRRSTSDPGQ
jgi:predicted DNA-binding transcriptional regulator AlpA